MQLTQIEVCCKFKMHTGFHQPSTEIHKMYKYLFTLIHMEMIMFLK